MLSAGVDSGEKLLNRSAQFWICNFFFDEQGAVFGSKCFDCANVVAVSDDAAGGGVGHLERLLNQEKVAAKCLEHGLQVSLFFDFTEVLLHSGI